LSRESDIGSGPAHHELAPVVKEIIEDADQPRRGKLTAGNLALLLFAIGAAACGQLLLKHGMSGAATTATDTGRSLVITAASSPFVWFGLTVFGISALAWMTTLSRVPLSIAYPFNAIGFLAVLTSSALILHEKTNIWTWVGTSMVAAGVIVVVTTRPH
jgi:drug/metabolite transporter (DMT)-like permease